MNGQSQGALLIALFVATIPLVAFARRFNVSYPIVLVLVGLVVGFVPGLPRVELDPNLVLFIFLPPLLYWEAITAPTDVILANIGQVSLMVVGLVLVTTAALGVLVHAIVPGMPWAVAFMLGAIVAPTDELASIPVLERLKMPRHLIAIVEGESLLNDATSLIVYAAAVTAAVTGTFNLGLTSLRFVAVAAGSIAIGWLVGRLAVEGWRRITDTQLQGAISFLVPFVAYEPAQWLGASGVLAVVTAGIYVNRYTPIVITPAARVLGSGYWDTFLFFANAGLFLLVGLQLHGIAAATFALHPWQTVLWYAVVVNVVLIGLRLAWLVALEYTPGFDSTSEHQQGDWKHAVIAAWSGLRGSVSLAAALAIPAVAAGGLPLPDRDLVIFLTFSVIVVTLVGGGLTLPAVIRWLNVQEADEAEEEQTLAVGRMSEAALHRIGALEASGEIDAEHARALRNRYEHRNNHAHHQEDPKVRRDQHRRIDAETEVLSAERRALIELHERGEIDNTVLRKLQRNLDRAETQYERNV